MSSGDLPTHKSWYLRVICHAKDAVKFLQGKGLIQDSITCSNGYEMKLIGDYDDNNDVSSDDE